VVTGRGQRWARCLHACHHLHLAPPLSADSVGCQPDRRAGGGALLRQWRLLAEFSQGELAARSHVSERTIRGLENGRIRSPHPPTINALASALALRPHESAGLARSWQRRSAPRSPDDVVHGALAAGVTDQPDTHVLNQSIRVVIDPDRRLRHATVDVVAQALHDGVDRFLVVRGDDAEGTRITALDGCVFLERVPLPEADAVAFTLGLGAPAQRGEIRAFRFRIASHAPANSDGFIQEVGQAAQLMLKVSFTGRVPSRVWELRNDRGVVVDEFGSVQLFEQNPEPRDHGFGWPGTSHRPARSPARSPATSPLSLVCRCLVRSHLRVIVLRVVRVLLILAGLVVLGIGFGGSFGHDNDGNSIVGDINCQPEQPDSPQSYCRSHLFQYGDTQVPATCLAGLGLICAAIALGQFETRSGPRASHQPGQQGQAAPQAVGAQPGWVPTGPQPPGYNSPPGRQ
jgi:transcriptional regulator with XRE-family HTH domain